MDRPQPPAPRGPRESPYEWNQAWCRYEGEAWDYIAYLLDEAVDVAVDSGAWRGGDGFGGHLVGRMRIRAMELGQVDREMLLPRGSRGERAQRKPLSAQVSLAVFARDDYTCVHCGTRENLTVDHIVPVSKGGTNDMDNLQTLCGPCNSRKGDRQ